MNLADFFEYENLLKKNILNQVETCLPARILSYNASTQTANIEILTRRRDKDGNNKDIAVLPEINVQFIRMSKFSIKWALTAGDTGRLVIFSKDISKYKKFGGKQNIQWLQNFALHNSIFIPDFHPQNETDEGEIAIDISANNELSIKQNNILKIKLNEDTTIDIIGDTKITGDVEIIGDLKNTGSVDIGNTAGKIQIGDTGNFTINGSSLSETYTGEASITKNTSSSSKTAVFE